MRCPKALFVATFCLLTRFACAENLTTLDKQTFQNYRVVKTEPDGIIIMHAQGGGKVAFTNLPPELQKQYGYDPVKAEELAKKQEKIRKLGRLGAVYRLSELEQAKAEAKRDNKPIAFLATATSCLQATEVRPDNSSIAATIQDFEALKNATVLVFSDSFTENHTEPPIVDAALHPPDDVHYTVPKVIIVDPDISKVIFVVRYATNATTQARLLGSALAKVKEQKKQ
ncbi:hypothetical protein [Pedosphaera parvula]|nr:hypothetical protein [Pedosphaera parvula]